MDLIYPGTVLKTTVNDQKEAISAETKLLKQVRQMQPLQVLTWQQTKWQLMDQTVAA